MKNQNNLLNEIIFKKEMWFNINQEIEQQKMFDQENISIVKRWLNRNFEEHIPPQYVWTARHNNKLIGYCGVGIFHYENYSCSNDKGIAGLISVFILKEYRKNKIGRNLIVKSLSEYSEYKEVFACIEAPIFNNLNETFEKYNLKRRHLGIAFI